MLGRDGAENLRILKKSQLKVDIGPWKMRVEFSTVAAVVKIFQISTDRDLKHHKMRHTLGFRLMVSIVRIGSRSSCRRTEVRSL